MRSPYCVGCQRTRKARRDRANSKAYRQRKKDAEAKGASSGPIAGGPPASAPPDGGGIHLDTHQAAWLHEILIDLVGIASQIEETSAEWDGSGDGDEFMKTYAEMAAEQVRMLVVCLRQPLRDSRIET